MTHKLLLIIILCGAKCFSQENIYNLDTLTHKNYNQLKDKSYYATINAKDVVYYVNKSPKKFKLLYTFTHFCKPCKEMFPKIIDLYKRKESKVDLFLLTEFFFAQDVEKTDSFLNENNSHLPVFKIESDPKFKNDKGKYKYYIFDKEKNKNVRTDRYGYFTQQLVPNHKEYGYSLIILFDENDKVIYASTYNEEKDEIFKKLLNFIDS